MYGANAPDIAPAVAASKGIGFHGIVLKNGLLVTSGTLITTPLATYAFKLPAVVPKANPNPCALKNSLEFLQIL